VGTTVQWRVPRTLICAAVLVLVGITTAAVSDPGSSAVSRDLSPVAAVVGDRSTVGQASPTTRRRTPTCEGRRATIVGPNRRDGRIVGTPLRDVIVTRGATSVSARAGDDTMCVRGSRGHGIAADLGLGADVFVGGAGDDVVRSGPTSGVDLDRDVVRTRGGDDRVVAGSSLGTQDEVHLGRGTDELGLGQGMYGGGSVDGGPGGDTIRVDVLPGPGAGRGGDLVLDARSGVGTRDGLPWLRVADLESYFLPSPHGNTLTFTGSRAAERLRLPFDYAATASEAGSIDMGAGDDVVALRADMRDRTVAGGAGTDTLRLRSYGRAGPDGRPTIPARNLTVSPDVGAVVRSQEGVTRILDLEAYAIISDGAIFASGTDRDERFVVSTCSPTTPGALPSQVFGSGGHDVLVAARHVGDGVEGPNCHGDPVLDGVVSFSGSAGDDVLVGGSSDDRLDGGDGVDRLDGRGGTNTCLGGETVARCQRLLSEGDR
jgi:hypothetical protein